MSLHIGQRLGSYEITSSIGKGGMGEVFRARDTKLQRDVAVKVPPDGKAKVLDFGITSFAARYAISRNGRFLMNEPPPDSISPVTLILNWKPSEQ